MTLPMHKKLYQAWNQYDLEEISNINGISGGLINETFRVACTRNELYIVQKLQNIFSRDLMADIDVIAEHLEKDGWECPRPLKTKHGKNFALVHSEIWRVYKYILGNDFSYDSIREKTYSDIGNLLGSFHRSLASLNYAPLHRIEGFHDKDFYISKALNIEKNLYSTKLQPILDEVIKNLEKYSTDIIDSQQVIHGDPRIENILFSLEGMPFTFIDYDTFMFGSIYIDVGDCLRSLLSLKDTSASCHRFQEFFSGYCLGNPEEKMNDAQALSALKYVTLELTLRFLIDSVEQSYFSWDPELYETSSDHNENRAIQHWNLFKKISQEL